MVTTRNYSVYCPRCRSSGPKELTKLPEEHHAVYICTFCRHTWCEDGREKV